MNVPHVPISRDRSYKALTSTESLRISRKMAGILKTVLCTEFGIPTKDKRGEKWTRRTAKGLCFISEALSEIMQHIENICPIGMRGLLTGFKGVCACFGAVLPLTSASSSLVLSRSIFSFQSLERSFSIQEDSKKKNKKKMRQNKQFDCMECHVVDVVN